LDKKISAKLQKTRLCFIPHWLIPPSTPCQVNRTQIYHNYIRPHEALDGKTPAEACGIVVEGENKWVTLIQNAAQVK
jgi:hypothetical protein